MFFLKPGPDGRGPWPEAFFGEPRGDFPFAGERGDFDHFERERFERGGGFSLFGLLRLGGNLLQVAIIVALVVAVERILAFGRKRLRPDTSA